MSRLPPSACSPVWSREAIETTVSELGSVQPWNHNFQLPYGVETRPGLQASHGQNLVKWGRVRPCLEAIGLEGRRVLDVGCGEGFFSFQAVSMGATVVGIDADDQRIAKARFVKGVSGTVPVDFAAVDIYGEDFLRLGVFDVCLCFGLLHRVPDPFALLSRLTQKADLLLLEWKALKFGPHDEPFAYFSGGRDAHGNRYANQYWLLSVAAVEQILRLFEFHHFHRIDDPSQRRAVLLAGRVDHPVFQRPHVVLRRPRMGSFLSHTKRYLVTLQKILDGRLNA